jgi:hypothetical protein
VIIQEKVQPTPSVKRMENRIKYKLKSPLNALSEVHPRQVDAALMLTNAVFCILVSSVAQK